MRGVYPEEHQYPGWAGSQEKGRHGDPERRGWGSVRRPQGDEGEASTFASDHRELAAQ